MTAGSAASAAAEERQRLEQRLRVLTRAIGAFAADTADYHKLLETVTRTVAEEIGDYCSLGLLMADGQRLQMASRSGDAEAVARIKQTAGTLVDLDKQAVVRRVVETGEPFYRAHLDVDDLGVGVPELLRALRDYGTHSVVLAPLRVRGRTVGVITLLRHRASSKPFEPADVELVCSVADHAALAIQNAELLAKQRDAFDRFFTLSLDMMAIAGTDGRFRRVSPAFRALGWSDEELTARPFIDFVHPEDVAGTLAETGKLAQGIPTLHFENRYRCKDGSYRWLQWTSAPDAETGTLYAIARDITEQRATAEALLRAKEDAITANRELESFSYSVAHDLRAPLRAMDGFSQALLEDYQDKLDDAGRDFLARLRQNAQRMAQLIDDLLQLSRVARAPLRREALDLGDLARMAFSRLRDAEPKRVVDVVIGAPLLVEGDERLLATAIDNLIDNAWKFSSRRPRARIEIGRLPQAGEPVYFVRDDGAGFDMRYSDKLFGAFQRLHSMTEFEGTGIGLATVQRVISRHGGRIWAESEVGHGATFYFTLRAHG